MPPVQQQCYEIEWISVDSFICYHPGPSATDPLDREQGQAQVTLNVAIP